MKAIVARSYGSPDVLALQEIPKPAPRDDEILLEVHAAALNAADWHMMRADPFPVRLMAGLFKPKFKIPGADVAGRATTTFRHLLALIGSILDQDPALTRAIQAENPEACSVIESFAEQAEALRHLLFEGDGSQLEARLAAVRAALR